MIYNIQPSTLSIKFLIFQNLDSTRKNVYKNKKTNTILTPFRILVFLKNTTNKYLEKYLVSKNVIGIRKKIIYKNVFGI